MSVLHQALAAGATVVTPNNRLARDAVARFDGARRAEGMRTWPAADALPWTLWLDRLWRAALAACVEPSPRALLDTSAARELWHSIVARHDRQLLNPRGAARRAAEAWSLFHAWRDADESIDRAVAGGFHADPTVFAQWAARYEARLSSLHALDAAQLPDVLAQVARPSWAKTCGPVVLHGFIAITCQQRRLVAALREAGMAVEETAATGIEPRSRLRTVLATPREEIAHALGFARDRLAANAQARVAVVVADLEGRRDEVVALADEILCPERLLSLDTDEPGPYGISLGEPLSSVPIVASALELIALACGRVDAGIAASVVRSPFLPDAPARWKLRADAERRWLELGERQVGWTDVLFALRRCDASLHRRLEALTPPGSRPGRLPRDWARAWSDWLAALGWPGTVTLTSAQWQAREAWSGALAKFAAAGAVTGSLPGSAALEMLRAMLGDMLFQPEAAPAQIQILGVLEAAGLSFDSAWLAGFDAQRWPESIAPNPFLPLAWQQARGVPRAHPDTALAQARQLTSALTSLAGEVVVSHVQTIDDAPRSISPLFADWRAIDPGQLPVPRRFRDAIEAGVMERLSESAGPPVPTGTALRGGAALFESQSACPFQAYARYRLDTSAWPQCPEGLSAAERGIVLHATLKAFWDGVGDHATLVALDAASLSARIVAAVEAAKDKLGAARWRALAPAVAKAEASRLGTTLRAWIAEGERQRPPFRVRAHERLVEYASDGFAVRVRIDRIDELASGGLAIIDYKSGRVVRPPRWIGERPEGVQLAVYASAVERTTEEPIQALAYAQVKAGEIALAGLTEAAELWPALDVAADAGSSWQEVRAQLRERVAWLAREIRSGVATVTPRDQGKICRHCGLDALCRIQVLDDRAGTSDPGAGDE